MARIRTIKPEFTTDEDVAKMPIISRYAFQNLWGHCDDFGNCPAKPWELKAKIFPYDNISREEMEEVIGHILEQGFLIEYSGSDGRKYWHVRNWKKHQKISRPSARQFPKFHGEDSEEASMAQLELNDDSSSTHGGLSEPSVSPRGALTIGKERKGKERKGKDNKGHSRFANVPPSIEEVRKRIEERGLRINPEQFVAYYEARNWQLGKGRRVMNWDACLTTWANYDHNLRNGQVVLSKEEF